ncbi:hypothetical protein HY994_02600 [Candidatus Micrarchaeota archaeon]|nr:hypothetical protein [Candidatus Micrarchaeota archaeon]
MEQTAEKPKIIITLDLVHTLIHRHGMIGTQAAVRSINAMETAAKQQVQNALKNHDVQFLDSTDIEKAFRRVLKDETLPIVSLDDLHVPLTVGPTKLYPFHLSRYYNADTGSHSHGPRRHAAPIEIQLTHLNDQLGGKDVALVDTGIYGGDTLKRCIARLGKSGINVKKIFAGVVRRKGFDRIKNTLPEIELVPVLGEQGFCDDWMFEMRDLIFGGRMVRKGGREIGTIHYSDAPEFFLPNPHVSLETRTEALKNINANELCKIGKKMRVRFNKLEEHTRMRIMQVKNEKVTVFDRPVNVHILRNFQKGTAW